MQTVRVECQGCEAVETLELDGAVIAGYEPGTDRDNEHTHIIIHDTCLLDGIMLLFDRLPPDEQRELSRILIQRLVNEVPE